MSEHSAKDGPGRDRDDERERRLHQGDPTYDPDDMSDGARRSQWREEQRYEDTGWMARRNFRGDRDYERRPQDEYGMGRRDWSRFESERGSSGQGQYGAGGFARGGYGQSGYGGDYGQRQHGQTSFGGEGRARSYGEGDARGGREEHDFEPDYLSWRSEQLADYDRDYAHWRQDQSRRHDEEYRTWRGERRGLFHRTFEDWRRGRDLERRTDELRTDDKIQEITEGHDPFRVRVPGGDDRERSELRARDRSASDDLAAGHNPALERQAEGRSGGREFPPLPRRDSDAQAREAYRGSGDHVETTGENPVLGRVAEGHDGGLVARPPERREGEMDEDYARRLEAARASTNATETDAGDPGISANPVLDRLVEGRDRGKDKPH